MMSPFVGGCHTHRMGVYGSTSYWLKPTTAQANFANTDLSVAHLHFEIWYLGQGWVQLRVAAICIYIQCQSAKLLFHPLFVADTGQSPSFCCTTRTLYGTLAEKGT